MEQSKTLGPKYFKQTLSKSYQIVSRREGPGWKESLMPILFYFCSDRNCCSVAKLYPTLCDLQTAARQASLSITNSRSLLKPMSIESVMPSNHLILCHPLLLLPSIFPSIRVFSNESSLLIRWPKYWSFSFSISLSNEYSGLISFRMDWLDLLAVQGTLKSLLHHHSLKAAALWWIGKWAVITLGALCPFC